MTGLQSAQGGKEKGSAAGKDREDWTGVGGERGW